MCTKAATGGAGSCGTGVVTSRMFFCTPAAGGAFGAFQCVVPKLMSVVSLSSGAKAQAALKAEGGGKGGEAWKDCKILYLRAGDGYDDSGRFFTDTAFFRFEPSGLLFFFLFYFIHIASKPTAYGIIKEIPATAQNKGKKR